MINTNQSTVTDPKNQVRYYALSDRLVSDITNIELQSFDIERFKTFFESTIRHPILEGGHQEKINHVLNLLKAIKTNNLIFEFPISTTPEPVDISFSVDNELNREEIMSFHDFTKQHTVPSTPHPTTGWEPLREIVSWWEDPDNQINQTVSEMWVSVDAMQDSAFSAPPNIYYKLGLDSSDSNFRERLNWFFKEIMQRQLSKPEFDTFSRTFRNVSQYFPETCSIPYLGLMLMRHPQYLRLILDSPPEHIIGFLSDIKWPGNMHQAESVFALCNGLPLNLLLLSLNMSDTLGKYIGFECYPQNESPFSNRHLPPILKHLDNILPMAKNQVDKLLSFSGIYTQEPDTTAHRGQLLKNCFIHSFNHFKVIITPQGEIQIKFYFTFINCHIHLKSKESSCKKKKLAPPHKRKLRIFRKCLKEKTDSRNC